VDVRARAERVDEGRIAESGEHAELLRRSARYRALLAIESRAA